MRKDQFVPRWIVVQVPCDPYRQDGVLTEYAVAFNSKADAIHWAQTIDKNESQPFLYRLTARERVSRDV